MSPLAKIASLVRAARRDQRGVAAAEFALIAPVVITLLLGGIDIATLVQIRLQLQGALRAGGQYALAFPTQTGGITAAVQQAMPATWTDVPTATLPLTGQSSCPTQATTPPGPGLSVPYYITLCASHPYAPLLGRLLGSTFQNSVTYVIRVQ
jgi:Flp pilus assembly protein TadG